GTLRPACLDVPVRVRRLSPLRFESTQQSEDRIMRELSGKTALVTGASRGIGRATALALAQAGAQVLVHYSSSPDEADAVVADIRRNGGKADKVGADLSKPDGAHVLAKQVRAIVGDRLDVLVANAGVAKFATLEDTTI